MTIAPREPYVVNRLDPDHPTHRERLLEAMAEAIREHGYRGTTVADVVRRARTSRRTFYEHFADRDACFVELFDALNQILSGRIAAALVPDAPWERQVELAVGAYVDEVYLEPELARACSREMPATGEAGLARQRQEIEQFADLLVALVAMVGERSAVNPMTRSTAILLAGGLRELVDHGLEHDTPASHVKATAEGVIKSVLDPEHRAWTGDPGES